MSRISQQTLARTASRGAARIGVLLLALVSPIAFVLLRWTGERLIVLQRYPYPSDGLEGTLLHEARLIRAGESLYQPLELHRFVSAPYPPVHPYVLSIVDIFAGPHVFWSGRLVSLISALLVALLAALIVRRGCGSWLAGILGAVLFLSAAPVILWATRIKPDMFALLWTALGLYLATRGRGARGQGSGVRGQGSGRIFPSSLLIPLSSFLAPLNLAAACFAIAFFTKQTVVAGVLAVGLALLIADLRTFRTGDRVDFLRRLPLRRQTLHFGLWYLGLVFAAWAALDLTTGGQYTYHVWEMHRGEGWSAHTAVKYAGLLGSYWPLMLLSAVWIILALRGEAALVPACYALVAPITLSGSGATGANHNHLLETLLALVLAGGCAVGWATTLKLARVPVTGLLIGLFALQFFFALRPHDWYTAELAPDDPPERFLALMRSIPGEVLADDIGLLYAAGKPIRYDDPAAMGPLAVSGHWDQSGLLEDISQRRFSAIMIPVNVDRETSDHAHRWSPEMIAAIREHYKPLYRDKIHTYVPREH